MTTLKIRADSYSRIQPYVFTLPLPQKISKLWAKVQFFRTTDIWTADKTSITAGGRKLHHAGIET